MKKKYIRLIVLLLGMGLLFELSSYAQGQKTVVVKDENGNPVAGASVTVGEGSKAVTTNEKGEFSMKLEGKTPVLIEAEGFDTQMITAVPLAEPQSIVMKRSLYQKGTKDMVSVPFGTLAKRLVPGAVTTIDPVDILNYDQGGSFTSAIYGRVPGLIGSTNLRGLGGALVVVDGIPRDASDLNLQQISSITVMKDLASTMLYGSQANNGIIYITTKHGKPLSKSMRFSASAGANSPISYPKFLGAADYMTLYNEALDNDGLPHKYSDYIIDNTRSGADPVHFPDQSYYNSTYLRDWSSYYNLVGEASGGNDIAQYYLNIGWNSSNSMLKLGEGKNEGTDRLNMRGNIDYKLTDDIKLRYNGSVIFNMQSAPRYTSSGSDFWSLSSSLLPDIHPVLIPSSLISDQTLLGAAKLVNGSYVLGGTSQYPTNIFGDLTFNGPRETNTRLMEMNFGLDYDLGTLVTPGLKASVNLSFDLMSNYITDILNTYAVYQPVYASDSLGAAITKFNKNGLDSKVDNQTLNNSSYYRRTGFFGTLDYNRTFGDHEISATALGYRDMYSTEGETQPLKHLQFGLRANYAYKNRYIVEATGVVTGSVKLYETDPWAFSKGIGFGWVLSEEDFLKGNSLVNYLKLHTNWALNNTDEGLTNYYLARDLYTASGSYTYSQGNYSNGAFIIANGNPRIGFEKEMNYNIGFESMLLGYKLGVEAAYFYNKSFDMLVRRQYSLPAYYTGLPFENYGSNQVQGAELGLTYTTNVSGVEVKLGGNLTYAVPKTLITDQLNYPEDYRRPEGKPTDAIFGYVATGLFRDMEDIASSPVQTFGTVKPGDIKYADLNGDNVIDDADQMMIGNSSPRMQYGLNLNLKYKGFELFALATGQTGQDRMFNSAYYWVYGTRKYSDVVLNRWTPETAETATYPRLTTLSNANDFRNSTFWMKSFDWFSLNTAQLTYTLPYKPGKSGEIKCYLRGGNLFMLSRIKDMAQLNVGSSPQTRTVSLGVTVVL